ncbi:SOS-induced cell division inhibitor SulA [Cronobacter dublinensis]|uniref:Cell division inhibitor SulA n=1 Tax=Cronobacter dublinensis 1210 TaxID=1208656 RepID=A0ABP1W5Y7_9ENTR|nr:SOS-induced cell division inhibitor SulA [Cronobacter dublinensis]EGT5712471.1 cell division inhibitor SulA [Cronobacter dublinensis subsp. dublinensis]CCJ80712.1 Cell division inhibitor [Cronobacter dublinensis 1210]ALB66318.1 cell division protein [Cronobacter dublinensis subsp. dublinensis LMG 23823]EGT4378901.1 cell division inhibitor SulA [Cronobacter dublinensis]EGT5735733.1 cell division inhibitor SulA [Cronobacter dublinensis subsp. dublinensis]
MYFSHQNRAHGSRRLAKETAGALAQAETKGLISEVMYNEDQPWMTQLVLLPLLQQLGQQSRWQLWLTPQQRLSREWVESSGLPLTKVMQVSQMNPQVTIDSMIRALETGNYSVVIAWLHDDLTDDEHRRLTEAAEKGNAMGFLMRPVQPSLTGDRPRSGLRIHSRMVH